VGSRVPQISMLNWIGLQSGRTSSADRGRKNTVSIDKIAHCIGLEFEIRSAAARCRLVYFILSYVHRTTLCVLLQGVCVLWSHWTDAWAWQDDSLVIYSAHGFFEQ